MPIYNLGLLPAESEWSAFTEYSAAIHAAFESEFVLGEGNSPHLTVLQVDWAEDPRELWAKVEDIAGIAVPLTLAGICLLPAGDGTIWIEVPVLKCAQLTQLQAHLLERLNVAAATIKNAVADDYRPHFTLGWVKETAVTEPPSIRHPFLRTAGLKTHLCLGRSGEAFQFEEHLFGDY